jgi:ribonuclease Z
MSSRFHTQLINDPFGDPGLYVEFMFEKRAILFDLGNLRNLPARKLLRVSDVFVSHMHMDHFCGFDRLLRLLLGRKQTLRLYGPGGLTDAVGHKLAAYTWNLVENYDSDLTLVVTELAPDRLLRTVEFHCRTGFRPQAERVETLETDRLLNEESFCVRTAMLDHGISCLAFALQERAHVNIWKNRIEERGLRIGPWLRTLKEAILREDPDETPIHACWKEEGCIVERVLALGDLRSEVATLTPGAKIAYVVDAAFTDANVERIVALAEGATSLFIETAFLHEDAERARARCHLTARQAGRIARRAGAKRLATLHYSPRYEGRGEELVAEAEAAFRAPGNTGG